MVAQQPSAMEGWRAVLMVVLRYRLGQWQRRRVSKSVTNHVDYELDASQAQSTVTPSATADVNEESWVEVDPVEAMVEGVKSKGVRSLLSQHIPMSLSNLRTDTGH
jgi:hypothetical protein